MPTGTATKIMPTFTEVRITIFEKDSLRATASVRVADTVYLTGIRVIEGRAGLFIAMPCRKTDGEYQDFFFPASKTMRDELSDVVLAAYKAAALIEVEI